MRSTEENSDEKLSQMTELQLLEKEMENAENFMSKGKEDAAYKPKVSTWGVFERPDNISKAYGGGKNLPRGGVNLDSDEAKAQQEKTRKLLQNYRRASGLEVETEEQYRGRVLEAIEKSNVLLKQGRFREALALLKPLTELVGMRSALGGDLHMQLAVIYEALGRGTDAKDLYQGLKKSPVQRIAAKAKRLSFGFYAMEEMKTDASSSYQMNWRLPEFTVKRKYETAYLGERKRKQLGLPTENVDEETSRSNELIAVVFLGSVIAFATFIILGQS